MASLSGMKAICQYYGKSEPTILKLIREEDFPATKIGGEWSSDADLIDDWKKAKIRAAVRAKRAMDLVEG